MKGSELNYNWQLAGPLIALLLLIILSIYHGTVILLLDLWNDLETGNYAHGYLVLGVSAYLVFRKRKELALLPPEPNYWGIIAIAVAGSLWVVASLVDIGMLQTVALLLIVLSTVWAVLGARILQVLLFPVLFIGFAIPIWFPLSPLLQDITADVVFWIVRIVNIPAMRMENIIVLPAGKLSIEESCGGLNYLLAALTLSTLYAYLNFKTFRARILVVLVAVAAAVLANIIRVMVIVYLAYKTEMQHPVIYDHISLGWSIFGFMVIILLLVDSRFINKHSPAENNNTYSSAGVQALCSTGKVQAVVFIASCVLFVVLGPVMVSWADQRPQANHLVKNLEFPSGVRGWSGPVSEHDDWLPDFRGAISKKSAYHKDGVTVYLYIGIYKEQTQGRELINDLNKIYNTDVWKGRYSHDLVVTSKAGSVIEQLIDKKYPASSRLVWYWYRVTGRNTTSKYTAKALQAIGVLSGNNESMIMAIASESGDTVADTRDVLDQFVADFGPALNAPLYDEAL